MQTSVLLIVTLLTSVCTGSAAQRNTTPPTTQPNDCLKDCLRNCGNPGEKPECERWCQEFISPQCPKSPTAGRPSRSVPKAPNTGTKSQ
jgi:hypothetical protein